MIECINQVASGSDKFNTDLSYMHAAIRTHKKRNPQHPFQLGNATTNGRLLDGKCFRSASKASVTSCCDHATEMPQLNLRFRYDDFLLLQATLEPLRLPIINEGSRPEWNSLALPTNRDRQNFASAVGGIFEIAEAISVFYAGDEHWYEPAQAQNRVANDANSADFGAPRAGPVGGDVQPSFLLGPPKTVLSFSAKMFCVARGNRNCKSRRRPKTRTIEF